VRAALLALLSLVGAVFIVVPPAGSVRAASYEFAPVGGLYRGFIRVIAVSAAFADDGRIAVGTSNGLFVARERGLA